MTNKNLCLVFVKGAKEGNGSNMRIFNNRLYSYNTCICERFVNETKYSVTTSRHQHYLRYALRNENVVEANSVPRGTESLSRYVKKA